MSNLISSEFYPVFPVMASKWSDSGVHSNEYDGRWESKELVLISLLMNNVVAAKRLLVIVPVLEMERVMRDQAGVLS